MKHFFLIVLTTFFANDTYAQGVTRNGEITNNGSEYVNKNGAIGSTEGVNKNGEIVAAVTPLQIGDSYQGGIVAYILVPGDPGYDANTQHGLIAATSNQGEVTIRWYNNAYVTTSATGTAIGTGSANTTAIIAVQGPDETSYAAGLARAYTGGGYTDWYLPSKDELLKLYLIKEAITAGGPYWSSSETSQTSASMVYFLNGTVQNTQSKQDTYYVRAVRSF